MGWFDENAPTITRRRTPGYQAPGAPADVDVSTPDSLNDDGTLASGNTGVSGNAGNPPPVTNAFARTAENNPGLDPAKWARGHASPKYAWHEIGLQHDLKTEAGRQAALAQAKQQYPQWFGSASWEGDDFLNLGPNAASEWNGVTGFDAVFDASGETGQTRPQMINETWAPGYGPATQGTPQGAGGGQALAGPVSSLTPAGASARPVGGSSPMNLQSGAGGGAGQTFGNGGYGVTGGQGMDAGFGSLLQPWEYEFAFPYFQAPGEEGMLEDPGYQFRKQQGEQAIQRSAAAQGTVLNPATVKALQDYNSGLASQEYGNVYNRRQGEHGRAHDQAFNEFSTAYNVFNRNQDTPFNRLATIAGLGQTSAGNLGAAGSAFAGNYGNTLMQGANAQGDYLTQGANANAAGRVGGANAWNSAIGNIGNNAFQSYYLSQMNRPPTQPQTQPPNFPGRWW